MILMALDHVRVFSGIPAGGSDPAVFFTRWVTHFCAPAFIFLAGTSAFLYGRRHGGLSRFLWTRGLWLVFLELTFLRLAWTFNFDFAGYALAGVIWVIGLSMILLAGLVRLPISLIAVIALTIVAGHNFADPHLNVIIESLGKGDLSAFWKILYLGFWAGPIRVGETGPTLWVLYSVIPWVAVMAAGYAFGRIITMESAFRNKLCLQIGFGAIAVFLVLRGFDLYGDPRPWEAQVGGDGLGPPLPAWLAFLNTNKYPASFLFLLMTLGPTITLIPALERSTGKLADWLTVFGRVPFFYYMLHIPLIHILALIVSVLYAGEVSPWLFTNHPMGNPRPPDGYTWGLPTLYAVWAVAILLLYFPSRWFVGIKARRKEWWISYL